MDGHLVGPAKGMVGPGRRPQAASSFLLSVDVGAVVGGAGSSSSSFGRCGATESSSPPRLARLRVRVGKISSAGASARNKGTIFGGEPQRKLSNLPSGPNGAHSATDSPVARHNQAGSGAASTALA